MAPNLHRRSPRGGQCPPLVFFVEKVVRDREGIGVEGGAATLGWILPARIKTVAAVRNKP